MRRYERYRSWQARKERASVVLEVDALDSDGDGGDFEASMPVVFSLAA
jgi:hypothetical protein